VGQSSPWLPRGSVGAGLAHLHSKSDPGICPAAGERSTSLRFPGKTVQHAVAVKRALARYAMR
jgi:hypothetical protein